MVAHNDLTDFRPGAHLLDKTLSIDAKIYLSILVTYCSIKWWLFNYLDYKPSYLLQSAPPKNNVHLLIIFLLLFLFERTQICQILPTKSYVKYAPWLLQP